MPGAHDTETGARDGGASRARSATALSERRWSFAAGACLVVAVALLILVGFEAAFVAAVLGALAWFWDQRNRIRANVIEDEHSEGGRDELEELDDEGDEGGRSDEDDQGDEADQDGGDAVGRRSVEG